MKEYLLKMSKWCLILAALAGCMSCSDDDSKVNTNLYSGTDITSYASITANKDTKKTSIEILKNGAWKLYGGVNAASIDFEEPLLQGTTTGTSDLNTEPR